MLEFDKKTFESFLHSEHIHDAEIKALDYDRSKNQVLIKIYNPIFHIGVDFLFDDVRAFLVLKGEDFGDSNTIYSMTLSDDYTLVKKVLEKCENADNESLYVLIETFSFGEIYVLSSKVIVNEFRDSIEQGS